MIALAEARRIVRSRARILPVETVPLVSALDRVLAADLIAPISRPAVALAAMDGYAVRIADLSPLPVQLRVVGIAAAGEAYPGTVQPGEAVRVLTGAPLPAGADGVVIQEHVHADGNTVVVAETAVVGRWIRPASTDFQAGATLISAGRRLTPRDLSLAAAANVAALTVRQRPRVAFVATGSELVPPGEWRLPAHTVNSNGVYLATQLPRWGAIGVDFGMVPDDPAALQRSLRQAIEADLVLTVGGASVGDRDLVLPVLASLGFEAGFAGVAMRPGKPSAFGWLGETPILVLPGNPASAVVGMLRLAQPLINGMLGMSEVEPNEAEAVLGSALPQNDEREDHLRARTTLLGAGALEATPFDRQDSGMTAPLAAADCLIVRPPRAAKAQPGDIVPIIRL
jgi:molybdenum cofactor synthesis domain